MTHPSTPAAAVIRNAERYLVLRCYMLSGSWPRDGKAPGGLIAFSAGIDDPNAVTLANLDQILDNMLGYVPHHDERTRADYQQWIRAETIERVKAISDVDIEAAATREAALIAERDQLRAAAVDLLAACKVAFYQTCSVGRSKDWNQIRDAIDKAERCAALSAPAVGVE